MMGKYQGGQAVVFLIVLIPVTLLISGLIARSGKLMLVHTRLQSHCAKKVLDSLMWQGRGLQELGRINPYARAVIQARRTIDALLLAGAVLPQALPALLRTRLILIKNQKIIEAIQKKTTANSILKSLEVVHEKVPRAFFGKVNESMSPSAPLPHPLPLSLTLHVRKESGFENELGAPLELDSDFTSRQQETLYLSVSSEKFLEKWIPLPREQNMKLQCQGQIYMKALELPWKAQLL